MTVLLSTTMSSSAIAASGAVGVKPGVNGVNAALPATLGDSRRGRGRRSRGVIKAAFLQGDKAAVPQARSQPMALPKSR